MRTQLYAWLCFVVVGCLTIGAVPQTAQAQAKTNKNPIEAPEVRKLTLRGVEHVDALDLERSIATSASECKNIAAILFCRLSPSSRFVEHRYLDHEELSRDILRIRVYYW